MLPPPGAPPLAVVNRYCVSIVAVKVVVVATDTVWDAVPPSDQLLKAYCVPAPPDWEVTPIVAVSPDGHRNWQGAVHVPASMFNVKPVGEVVIETGISGVGVVGLNDRS